MKKFATVCFIVIGLILISFVGVAAVVKLFCWAFGFTFNWRIAVGVYAAMTLVSWCVKGNSKK